MTHTPTLSLTLTTLIVSAVQRKDKAAAELYLKQYAKLWATWAAERATGRTSRAGSFNGNTNGARR